MFSIIIPSYNRNEEIPALLESLLHQTRYNFEVIIVDDHSIKALEIDQFYPFPIHVIRNKQNEGAGQSRNIGANYASKEWLLFLDDDDRFVINKCEVLEKEINANPSINFIYHPAECLMINENFSYTTSPYKDEKEITLDNILGANKIGGMPMVAVKKSLFFQVGGFSIQLRALEDYELLLKLILTENFLAKYIDMPLTKCAFHTQRSSVSTNTLYTENAIQYIMEKYVKTERQKENFSFNSLYILAYPYIMNLSRKASQFYFQMFLKKGNIKYLVVAVISFISPKWAINLKRFN